MPDEAERPRDERPLSVTVVRSGGMAGLRRSWEAEPPAAESDDWLLLIDACPWDAPSDDPGSRDRFVWSISARFSLDGRDRSATVPERELTGPWRELVDRVRQVGVPVPPRDGGDRG